MENNKFDGHNKLTATKYQIFISPLRTLLQWPAPAGLWTTGNGTKGKSNVSIYSAFRLVLGETRLNLALEAEDDDDVSKSNYLN